MLKATPVAPFVMSETDLLFELEVISFDAPAHFGGGHQFLERDGFRQGGQKIVGRLGFIRGPFDEQPLLRTGSTGLRCVHAHPREARGESRVGAFAPSDRTIATDWEGVRIFV